MNDLINSTDADIEEYVQAGDPMTLRGLLYQLTGDEADRGDETRRGPGHDLAATDAHRPARHRLGACGCRRVPPRPPGCRRAGHRTGADGATPAELAARRRRRDPRRSGRVLHRGTGDRTDPAPSRAPVPPGASADFHVVVIGCGSRWHQRRHQPQGVRHPVHGAGEERRRRAARGTTTAIRVAASTCRASPTRTASDCITPGVTGSRPAREQQLSAVVRGHVRRSGRHPVLHRGDGDDVGRGHGHVARRRQVRRRRDGNAERQCRDRRGRLPVASEVPGDQGMETFAGPAFHTAWWDQTPSTSRPASTSPSSAPAAAGCSWYRSSNGEGRRSRCSSAARRGSSKCRSTATSCPRA